MFRIESCKVWSNRYWIVDESGKRVHSESTYDQIEYICNSMNRSRS